MRAFVAYLTGAAAVLEEPHASTPATKVPRTWFDGISLSRGDGRRGSQAVAAWVLAASVALASCAGATGSSGPPSDTASVPRPSRASATASFLSDRELVATWTRTQDCASMLGAFVEAGLAASHAEWIVGGWVGDPAEIDWDPEAPCAGARPAEKHSHFFTADGQFGSYDAEGEQVDSGDYAIVDSDTLSFRSHSTEFGYDGDILVDYAISGDNATFEVQIPPACDARCAEAHAWALSAFFGPDPWSRAE